MRTQVRRIGVLDWLIENHQIICVLQDPHGVHHPRLETTEFRMGLELESAIPFQDWRETKEIKGTYYGPLSSYTTQIHLIHVDDETLTWHQQRIGQFVEVLCNVMKFQTIEANFLVNIQQSAYVKIKIITPHEDIVTPTSFMLDRCAILNQRLRQMKIWELGDFPQFPEPPRFKA